jgi:hypothetical protein
LWSRPGRSPGHLASLAFGSLRAPLALALSFAFGSLRAPLALALSFAFGSLRAPFGRLLARLLYRPSDRVSFRQS